ncbi:MAG: hypothetical protein ACLFWB_06645, partial [Armatimonadota bacterium]
MKHKNIYSFVIMLLAVEIGLLIGGGNLRSYDVWWHLQQGLDTISNASVRLHDIYSHTNPGGFRPPQQWLFEVVQAGFYQLAEERGMIGLRMLLAVANMGLLALLLLRRKSSYLLMAAVIPLVASASMPTITCRPHLLLPMFLLATIAIARASRRDPWAQWLLPPLFLLWVNMHASFLVGLAFVGIWAAQKSFLADPENPWEFCFDKSGLLQAAGVTAAVLAACCINPIGPRMLIYPLQYLPGGPLAWHAGVIQEWQSPDLGSLGRSSLAIILFAGSAITIVEWRRATPFEISVVLLMLVMGLRWQRSDMQSAVVIAYIAIPLASAPLRQLSPSLLGWSPDSETAPHRLVPVMLAVIFFVGLLGISRVAGAKRVIHENIYPVQLATWANDHDLEGNMYNPMRWGGYMIHRLYPKYRVFIDGRMDMYPRELCEDYLTINHAEAGWEEIAQKHGVEWGF